MFLKVLHAYWHLNHRKYLLRWAWLPDGRIAVTRRHLRTRERMEDSEMGFGRDVDSAFMDWREKEGL